ncbi:hypothetical protein CK222_26155 [Mesorhizobium sp. WSM3866]|nr:hypothetical protein CK222_26155 [Mesorhizobium sp. WSM3866]PBB58356.1 hypothetical protein CK217_30380 [Mesorhizobium loti]
MSASVTLRRVAFSQIAPTRRRKAPSRFLKAALASVPGLRITVDRVMTDNGPCYRFKAFAKACRKLGRKPHIEPTLNPLAKIAGFYCADQEGFSLSMPWMHPIQTTKFTDTS